MENLPIM